MSDVEPDVESDPEEPTSADDVHEAPGDAVQENGDVEYDADHESADNPVSSEELESSEPSGEAEGDSESGADESPSEDD